MKHDFYNEEAETKLINIKDLTDYSYMIHPNTEESAREIYELLMDGKNAPDEFLVNFKNGYKKLKLTKKDYSAPRELTYDALTRIGNFFGI